MTSALPYSTSAKRFRFSSAAAFERAISLRTAARTFADGVGTHKRDNSSGYKKSKSAGSADLYRGTFCSLKIVKIKEKQIKGNSYGAFAHEVGAASVPQPPHLFGEKSVAPAVLCQQLLRELH